MDDRAGMTLTQMLRWSPVVQAMVVEVESKHGVGEHLNSCSVVSSCVDGGRAREDI